MDHKEFRRRCRERAFSGGLGNADLFTGIATLVLAVVAAFWKPLGDAMSWLPAAVFLAAFAGLVGYGLWKAPYWLYEDLQKERNILAERLESRQSTAQFVQSWQLLSGNKTTFMTLIGKALTKSPYKGNFRNEGDFLDSEPGFPAPTISNSRTPLWAFFRDLTQQVQDRLRDDTISGWLSVSDAQAFHDARLALSGFWRLQVDYLYSERIAQNAIIIEHLEWDSRVIKALALADCGTHLPTGHADSIPRTLTKLGSIYVSRQVPVP